MEMVVEGKEFSLEIWDTAGQEMFRSLTSMYYRNSHATILVFDVTERGSFDQLPYWIEQVKYQAWDKTIIHICANKVDLEEERKVDFLKLKKLAHDHEIGFSETSAVKGKGIEQMFEDILAQIENLSDILLKSHDNIQITDKGSSEQPKTGCCW
ncbi:MAG: hypothetical protein Ta2E_09000 [Mycoplasmoidaceae bacterium]|nr:MAG: hypothetical protein Ta2E_09000 [Mycoplasmoidaceae bacterium]